MLPLAASVNTARRAWLEYNTYATNLGRRRARRRCPLQNRVSYKPCTLPRVSYHM